MSEANFENMTIRMESDTAMAIRKISWDMSAKPHERTNAMGIKKAIYKRVTLGDVVAMAVKALERELSAQAVNEPEEQELPDHTAADDLKLM